MQRSLLPFRLQTVAIALFLLLLSLFAIVHVAHAHETRAVGPYTFVVGFAVEPAYEGQINGVQLRVREGEGDEAVPIEGVEATLEVEVTHLSSGATEVMELRPVFRDPGHYRNYWIPSAPGDYRFRFFGSIGDLEVDETFESGPNTFNAVEPADVLYFPEEVAAARELEGAVRGAQGAADEALGLALGVEDELGSARTLTITALSLAIVALIVGAVALITGRRG